MFQSYCFPPPWFLQYKIGLELCWTLSPGYYWIEEQSVILPCSVFMGHGCNRERERQEDLPAFFWERR